MEDVQLLIGHPAVRRVNFTGSSRVEKIVVQTSARYLKSVLLESGARRRADLPY